MFSAEYFDGRSTGGQAVTVRRVGELISVRSEGGFELNVPITEISIGEQLGSAPRMIALPEGQHLEVSDHQAFESWLTACGLSESSIDLAQRSWLIAGMSAFFLILSVWAFYRWGLPPTAGYLSERVPAVVTEQISQATLDVLEGHLDLQPSQLSPERQASLQAGFALLNEGQSGRLLMRSSRMIGANAMALPDGTIVLFDELVRLADHDDQIMAVLAHELAHVTERHSLRLMVEGSIMAAFIAWWLGDISPVLVGAPTALLQARHSRQAETEADLLGMQIMCRAGFAPSGLGEMLTRIENYHLQRQKLPSAIEDGSHDDEDSDAFEMLEYLSSHPATQDRIERLNRAAAADCS